MTLEATVLADDALRATPDGFELDVHLNWYRTLPLSSVKTVELTVDGEPIERDAIVFSLAGGDHALDELPARWQDWWFVLDTATLKVRRSPPLEHGQEVDLRLALGMRIPYILVGPETTLEQLTVIERRLTAR